MTLNKELLDMSEDEIIAHVHDLRMAALNLAQDLSMEFEAMNIRNVIPEFREEEIERRQDAGIRYMEQAYAIAGIKHLRLFELEEEAEALNG